MEDWKQERLRYFALILVVVVSGASQGLLLSLLAIILEKEGVSSSLNSFSAIWMYVGIMLVTPFLELPVRRFGYKPVLLAGLGLVTLATLLFPAWQSLIFWMILRFLVGVGDAMLHFASQTWIVSTTAAGERGKKISFYGFSYGLGFGIGPLGINLLSIHPWAPFLALVLLYGLAGWLVFRLRNGYPETSRNPEGTESGNREARSAAERYRAVLRFSWFALLPPLMYGYLESSLNTNFPVYALRMGISQEWVSILLPAFVIGSLLLQMPLGLLSDRLGRKKVLMAVCFLGGAGFLLVPSVHHSEWLLLSLFILVGGWVGSTYSLGVAYAADLLPKFLLPTANLAASFLFGVGSIVGAYANGLAMQYIHPHAMFYLLSGCYFLTVMAGMAFKAQTSSRTPRAGEDCR